MTVGERAVRWRWGIEHWFGDRWAVLGTGWMPGLFAVPECLDIWPASFKTCRAATVVVQQLRTRHATYSGEPWKFRVVRLCLVIEAVPRRRGSAA